MMNNYSIIKVVADYKLAVSSLLLATVPFSFYIPNKNKKKMITNKVFELSQMIKVRKRKTPLLTNHDMLTK